MIAISRVLRGKQSKIVACQRVVSTQFAKGFVHTSDTLSIFRHDGVNTDPLYEETGTVILLSDSMSGNTNRIGRLHTAESRTKMSEARKLYWKRKREQESDNA